MTNSRQWKESIQGALAAVAGPVQSLEDCRLAVIKEWRERFTRRLRDGTSAFQPIIQDLMLKATGPLDSVFPELDLSSMTIKDWTRIIYASSPVESNKSFRLPPWFEIAALECLGFSNPAYRAAMQPLRLARDDGSNLEDRDAIWSWSGLIRPQWRRGAVILTHEAGRPIEAVTDRWKPSTQFAAMQWPLNRWIDDLFGRGLDGLNGQAEMLTNRNDTTGLNLKTDLGIDTLMIELAADDDTTRAILANPSGVTLPKPFNPTDYRVVYLARNTATANRTFPHPNIITPSNLDDAITAGDILFTSSTTPQPAQPR